MLQPHWYFFIGAVCSLVAYFAIMKFFELVDTTAKVNRNEVTEHLQTPTVYHLNQMCDQSEYRNILRLIDRHKQNNGIESKYNMLSAVEIFIPTMKGNKWSIDFSDPCDIMVKVYEN